MNFLKILIIDIIKTVIIVALLIWFFLFESNVLNLIIPKNNNVAYEVEEVEACDLRGKRKKLNKDNINYNYNISNYKENKNKIEFQKKTYNQSGELIDVNIERISKENKKQKKRKKQTLIVL